MLSKVPLGGGNTTMVARVLVFSESVADAHLVTDRLASTVAGQTQVSWGRMTDRPTDRLSVGPTDRPPERPTGQPNGPTD